jgi:hypothetical protein
MALTEKFDVGNLERWGQLVKSWATDLDYIDQDFSQQPPRDNWVKPPSPANANSTPAPATVPADNAAWALPAMNPVTVTASDGSQVTLPRVVAITAAQFSDLLAKAGVQGVSMPERYKNVVIVQGDDEVMIVRLPPRQELQGSEDDLLNGQVYPVRPFYTELFEPPEGAPHMPATNDQAAIMLLHANRIGEYTLNTCN